jgi:hypothetical protein
MGQNGGARPGAGRKPKILEVKLIEQMDAISVPEQIWNALLFKCQQGDTQAIKLWLSYRFGLPKQQIDVTTNGEKIAPPIQWIGKNIAIESAKVISEEEEEESPQRLELKDLEEIALNNKDHQEENKLF